MPVIFMRVQVKCARAKSHPGLGLQMDEPQTAVSEVPNENMKKRKKKKRKKKKEKRRKKKEQQRTRD